MINNDNYFIERYQTVKTICKMQPISECFDTDIYEEYSN